MAESRETYEKYKFLITEDSKTKNEMLRDFGERVADALGAAGNTQLSSAATLCACAVVPAISAVLQGQAPPIRTLRKLRRRPSGAPKEQRERLARRSSWSA